ncbi:MAG: hypothetical protein HYS66_01900, partial [Deltaproteobacteria bacterium]|nr:hypothetical protein [Deltaproteobacteria bacterium]
MTILQIFFLAVLIIVFTWKVPVFNGAPARFAVQAELANAQESLFSGKTIRIVVGSSPGGGYDYWARLLARHMPKYLSGNPEVVVQNMPGGGS